MSELMTLLDSRSADFNERLDAALHYDSSIDREVEQTVAAIIDDVRREGDAALLRYTNRFDQRDVADSAALELPREACIQALSQLPVAQAEALQAAAASIRAYHEHQVAADWQYQQADGTMLGQKVTPLDRACLYVPGGKAAYPSSVLMNAIPARVAGVGELIMVVPAPRGELNPLVLAAAEVAGIDRVFTIGGAQAVAALAYGTETVPRVDKITGPGNIWVATAKRQVFGVVGIDMIAGPSEICIYSDGSTPTDWLAMDLFSQAEHDELAQSILISCDAGHLAAVHQAALRLLPEMPRREIIQTSLTGRGLLILAENEATAMDIINRIAPEHLELSVAQPERLLSGIRHAGAIFMGAHTAESLGDYCAGPNHVLPTSGTARFSSPLGVYDFQKRSSLICFSAEGAARAGAIASVLARGEGLVAHARSAEYRMQDAAAD